MATLSVRFKDSETHSRLQRRAAGSSLSALAERLIDEGLRMDAHPGIVFRDGPTGRRAGLAAGLDVWQIINWVKDQEGSPEERVAEAAQLLDLPVRWVQIAVRYYAEFTEEIDARIEANDRAAEEGLAAWEREQRLLSK
ncbi:MAG: hypothetical protein H0X58_03715 [Acidimicrobiia bacterium]|jgi:hypothetical protein|nr:hypothetical protein [Acidimicrobiia bacterium]MBA3955751.1 hypothetical protein [Acidimicrobiia bacterium]